MVMPLWCLRGVLRTLTSPDSLDTKSPIVHGMDPREASHGGDRGTLDSPGSGESDGAELGATGWGLGGGVGTQWM